MDNIIYKETRERVHRVYRVTKNLCKASRARTHRSLCVMLTASYYLGSGSVHLRDDTDYCKNVKASRSRLEDTRVSSEAEQPGPSTAGQPAKAAAKKAGKAQAVATRKSTAAAAAAVSDTDTEEESEEEEEADVRHGRRN
jgi:hypothetical protein